MPHPTPVPFDFELPTGSFSVRADRVRVPAGEFDVIRFEYDGGEQIDFVPGLGYVRWSTLEVRYLEELIAYEIRCESAPASVTLAVHLPIRRLARLLPTAPSVGRQSRARAVTTR
jgi:hypothetical protein